MRGRRRRRRTYESPVAGRVNFADEFPSLHQLFEERLYFVLSGDVVRKRCCCWTGTSLARDVVLQRRSAESPRTNPLFGRRLFRHSQISASSRNPPRKSVGAFEVGSTKREIAEIFCCMTNTSHSRNIGRSDQLWREVFFPVSQVKLRSPAKRRADRRSASARKGHTLNSWSATAATSSPRGRSSSTNGDKMRTNECVFAVSRPHRWCGRRSTA